MKEPYRKEFAEEKDLFKPLIRLPTQKLVKLKEQIEEGKKIKAGTGFCYGSLWVSILSYEYFAIWNYVVNLMIRKPRSSVENNTMILLYL